MSRDLTPDELFRRAVQAEAERGDVGLMLIDVAHKAVLPVDDSGTVETVYGTPAAFLPLGGGSPVALPRTWLSAALSVADGDRLTLPVDWDEATKTFRVHLPDDATGCKVVAA